MHIFNRQHDLEWHANELRLNDGTTVMIIVPDPGMAQNVAGSQARWNFNRYGQPNESQGCC
jgi:hypothetical protein